MPDGFSVIGAPVGPERDHYQRVLNFEQSQMRRFGMSRLARYLDNRQYFYGEQGEDDSVKMPLGIRYAGAIVQKHAHYLWGQWDRDIVDWVATQVLNGDATNGEEIGAKIARAIYYLIRRAGGNDKLYKGGLNAMIYGDGVFRVRYKADLMGATFESVLPEYYHSIWDPVDINETLEVCVAYNLDRQTALQRFGTAGNPRSFRPSTILDPGLATVWEWWSPWERMLVVDDQIADHTANPFKPLPTTAADGSTTLTGPGLLPFVHCPNLGLDGEYWGFGHSEGIHALQDEINLRLADMGDIVAYHSHPITILQNFWGRARELLVAPDAVWDMGREGDARYLQWDGPPPQIFEYIELLIRVMLETSNLTPIAFGRSDQSQASGQALQVAMLPVTEVVRRERSQWGPRLTRLAKLLLTVEEAALGPDVFTQRYGFALADLDRYEITPRFAPILPRDRLAVVNEITQRLVNKAISITRALEQLGEDDPKSEKDRIFAEIGELAKLQAEGAGLMASATGKLLPNRDGGKNSTSAKGGSNTDPNPEDS